MEEVIHKHHILPRHAGGTDEESNLYPLSVVQHALAHRNRWVMNWDVNDRIAWMMLSGQWGKEDARIEAWKEGYRNRDKSFFNTEEYQQKQRLKSIERGARPPILYGDDHPLKNPINKNIHLAALQTEEYKSGQSKDGKQRWANTEYKAIMCTKLRGIPKPQIECPHCHDVGGQPNMIRWHFDNCPQHPTKKNVRISPLKGRILGSIPIVKCPVCGKTGGKNAMTRFHFDNCKEKQHAFK